MNRTPRQDFEEARKQERLRRALRTSEVVRQIAVDLAIAILLAWVLYLKVFQPFGATFNFGGF